MLGSWAGLLSIWERGFFFDWGLFGASGDCGFMMAFQPLASLLALEGTLEGTLRVKLCLVHWGVVFSSLKCVTIDDYKTIEYYRITFKFYNIYSWYTVVYVYVIVIEIMFECIPVGPHKAVAEVSEKETYRRVWLLWSTDGKMNPLMDRKVVGVVFFGLIGCNGCSGHLTHNCWM